MQKASYLITRFCVQSCGNVLQEVATSSALCDMLAQLVARVAMWQNTSFELECNNPDPRQEDVVHITLDKCKNAALVLRLSLPSTLIHHEKGSFSETLFKPEEFEKAALR